MGWSDFLKNDRTRKAVRYGQAIKNVLRRKIEKKLDASEKKADPPVKDGDPEEKKPDQNEAGTS